jgi:hypothetical protein
MALSFGDYWLRLVNQNKGLASGEDAKMTITVAAFRKAMEQAYATGREAGVDTQSMFRQMFGNDFPKRG